ncbi:MAG: hypothetical protein KBI32_10275 [Phycisphaerae bacterium]|nr:hypothetical protein [Phycisphaerae bacterium]
MNDLTPYLAKQRLSRAMVKLDELENRVALGLPNVPTPSDERRLASNVRDGLALVAREVRDKTRTVVSNGDLSDSGKVKQLEAIAASIRPRIEILRKAVTNRVEERLATLRAQLTQPLTGRAKDDVIGEVRAGEIRTRLSAMDEASRIAKLWNAVDIGDEETLHAIATAPKSFSIVGGDDLAKATEAFWQKQQPEIVEEISDLETIGQLLADDFQAMDCALDNLAEIARYNPASEGQTSDETE